MLLQFCQKFERLYGKSKVKPNMHLHGHLKECVLDYGPVYNFWCFSFERFNGILSSFKTNNRCIEIQLMRKLLSDHFISCSTLPKEFAENCLPLLSCSVTDSADHYWHCKFGTQAYECSLASYLLAIDWNSLKADVHLRVDCFLQHTVKIGEQNQQYVFALVDWHDVEPVEIWKKAFFPGCPSRYLPVARIYCKFAVLFTFFYSINPQRR